MLCSSSCGSQSGRSIPEAWPHLVKKMEIAAAVRDRAADQLLAGSVAFCRVDEIQPCVESAVE